jgi:hypothetical protein
MVSTSHFRQEFRAQLGRAAARCHIDILINSGELYRFIVKSGFSFGPCCDAMRRIQGMGHFAP